LKPTGTIKSQLKRGYLSDHQHHLEWLDAFRHSFDISYGREERHKSSSCSVYILRPHSRVAVRFGWDREVLLCYAPYDTLHAVTLELAQRCLRRPHIGKGRVHQYVILLVCDGDDATSFVRSYQVENPEAPSFAAFCTADLRRNRGDGWYVQNQLASQLFTREVFDNRLPLNTDQFFFGRQKHTLGIIDAVKTGENIGIFGLRKVGKTSLLLKVQRALRKSKGIKTVLIDCKNPAIRMRHWSDLLRCFFEEITGDELRSRGPFYQLVADFSSCLNDWLTRHRRRAVLIVDEFEYISPYAVLDPHWKTEFLNLWQTIWAYQTSHRNLVVVFAGVSGAPVERPLFDGVQNPLFGLVRPVYLAGFGSSEISTMVKTLGRYVGLKFSAGARDYLAERYGGHPLLTRLVCSIVNREMPIGDRPATVERAHLEAIEQRCERELQFYPEHVITELRTFYPIEYEALSLLARGDIRTFSEFADDDEITAHLRRYGMVTANSTGRDTISIPMISRHIALSEARKTGTIVLDLVPTVDRVRWLEGSLRTILNDFRLLERRLDTVGVGSLCGGDLREVDHLLSSRVVASADDWRVFINILNRSLVEAIESFGHIRGIKNYFWSLEESVPAVFDSLMRIKCYRHHVNHLTLKPRVEERLRKYQKRDLPSGVPSGDVPFALQQATVDNLVCDLQVELARL